MVLSVPGALAASDWSQDVKKGLEDRGFEGIRTSITSQVAVLKYENRVFRCEMEALGIVADAGIRGLPGETQLVLIPTNRGVPILRIVAAATDWSDFLSGGLSAAEFQSRVTVGSEAPAHGGSSGQGRSEEIFLEPPSNGMPSGPPVQTGSGDSRFKIDIALRPLAELRLGIADNPFEYGLWAAPEITMSPIQGVLVTSQAIVTVHDEFDPFARDLSPGRNTLSVWNHLPGEVLGVVSGGYFPGNRYGFAWEAGRFLAGGLLEARVAGDYSGFLKFSKGNRVLYSGMKAWSGLGSLIVRPRGRDLELNVTAGKFIHGDKGARVDVLRRFQETDFGFFVSKTNEGTVGGFRFKIPLPVRHQMHPAPIRPVTVPDFPFEYREDQEPTGRRVRMFDTLDRVRKGLTPAYFRNNLEDLRRSVGRGDSK